MNPWILLVEDDPTSRAFLQAATESLPARVDTAASLSEALALARANPYALWLVDANLPDGSGAELLARLRGLGLATPALAHTASREHEDHRALRAAGFIDTLVKPLPAGRWCDAIRRALDGAGADPAAPAGPQEGRRVEEPQQLLVMPLWDDARALAALAGDAGNVAAMRGLFLAELPAARETIARAAAAGEEEALRGALHRLEAGCGFVGATRLAAAVARLRTAPDSAGALRAFDQAAQETLPGA